MAKLKTLFDMMNDDSVLKELVDIVVMDAYISGMEKSAIDAKKELDDMKAKIKEKDEYILELESQIGGFGV